MNQYDCDAETAQFYCNLRDDGHAQHAALVMSGLADPYEPDEEE